MRRLLNMNTSKSALCILGAALLGGSLSEQAEAAKPKTSAPDRSNPAAALIRRYCYECHGKGNNEGNLSLDGVNGFGDAKPDLWDSIYEQVQLGLMPPKDGDAMRPEERRDLLEWISQSMRAEGHTVSNKLEWPNYGNYVSHEELFGAKAHPAPATRVRLWRQRPETYVSRNASGTQAFSLLAGQQISDYSAIYTIDESASEIILRNAESLVAEWTPVEIRGGVAVWKPGKKPLEPAFLELLNADQKVSPEAFQKCINYVFLWALNRKASQEELERIRSLYEKASAAHGPLHGARAALMVGLLKPEAVYRLELGQGDLDEHGRRRLSKEEILNALQYTLFSDLRSPKPLEAARADAQRQFTQREEVASLVWELIGGPGPGVTPNERVLGFFDEYFDYRKAKDVFKDRPPSLVFQPELFINDTKRLIASVVSADRDVLKRLLTTSQTFAGGTDTFYPTHHLYNLPPDWPKQDGLVELNPEERAGILTQPSWLVAYSGNFDNDPVRRGKWVLERLLGGTVPEVPVTVCANVPREPGKTLRERFAVISNDSYCWKCHKQMNQLGMPFEAYDHFGRYRLQELKKPVDSRGAVIDSGSPALDGPVQDAVELMQRLGPSQRAKEVFVRYAFRYFLGRNETVRDAKTLQEALAAYDQSGGSFKALVVSLLASDSMLFRTPLP
ncbi:MAG: hypothetical protein RLZZ399_1514 [Verrucomicrobiota bacterium]